MDVQDWREEARRARYVVIGPSGWIGRVVLHWIANQMGEKWRDQTLCFGSSTRDVAGPDGRLMNVLALSELAHADLSGAIVFHLAYLTKDKTSGLSDTDFFGANLSIDEAVLDAVEASQPRGIFVASSGAARDAQTGEGRNLYGITKLLQEDRFLSHAQQTGLQTLVGRIFNIAGAHINKFDLYAISSFAQQGLTKGHIEVSATIPVFRSFLGATDMVEIIIAELLTGAPRLSRIDLCGAELLEMGQIASVVGQEVSQWNGKQPVTISRPAIDFTRSSSYFGDARPVLELSLRHGIALKSFQEQTRETVEYVATTLNA